MAQQSNEHLTTAELSAYLDQELTPAEMELYDAHIRSCRPCQAALADLRLTSALLSSMPQVAVPRSFTLPTNLVILPETPDTPAVHASTRAPDPARIRWSRSLRALSTLAAMLGLLFFLAGALGSLPHGGATTSMGAPAASSIRTAPAPASTSANTPTERFSPNVTATATRVGSVGAAVETPTPLSTAQPTFGTQDQPPITQQVSFPAALDLGQAEGRLVIGAALFLLGVLGLLAALLLRRPARR